MAFAELEDALVNDLLEERLLFSEDDRVSKAAGHLKETKEYEVFTTREKRLSYATVRDLLDVKNPHQTRLGNVSFYSPQLEKSEKVGRAAQLMYEYRLRAIPCSVEGGSAKVISASGIVERMAKLAPSKITANDIMTPSPVTIMADETAEKARQTMLRRSFDHLPVIKDGKLFGMLTSANLLEHLLPEESLPGQFRGKERFRFDFEVSRIAEESLIEVEPDTGLDRIIAAILEKRSTYALVTLWDEVQGIVTLRDLVRLLIRRRKTRTPYYIVGLPNEPFEAGAAKMKMDRLGESLTKTFPSIEEIRAVVKSKANRGPKRRYEVTVSVYTPRSMHSYVAGGYDLSEIFDEIGPMLKRLLSSKQSKVTKMQGASIRKSSGQY